MAVRFVELYMWQLCMWKLYICGVVYVAVVYVAVVYAELCVWSCVCGVVCVELCLRSCVCGSCGVVRGRQRGSADWHSHRTGQRHPPTIYRIPPFLPFLQSLSLLIFAVELYLCFIYPH